MGLNKWIEIDEDFEHNLLRVVHDNFKWILRLEHYAEKVRKHEQKRLLSKYGVPEPSQRWPPTRKRKEKQ